MYVVYIIYNIYYFLFQRVHVYTSVSVDVKLSEKLVSQCFVTLALDLPFG